MRMRFWATIRKPAFSISALTAPVRLRSVASGLRIEKVRSIAIVYVLAKHAGWRVAALISAPPHDGKRPCDAPATPFWRVFVRRDGAQGRTLQQFHAGEPCLKPPCRLHSASRP